MKLTLASSISQYGAEAKTKFANPSVTGEPEDQLRAPLETLFAQLAELCGFPGKALAAVGALGIFVTRHHSRVQTKITALSERWLSITLSLRQVI